MNTTTILDARVVQEPKVISLKEGKSLTKLRLADNPPGKKDDKRPARFVTGKSFGKQGEALAKLSKGDVIAVSGSLQIEEYEKKDGTKATDDVLMIDRFRVVKSESFYGDGPAKPKEDESLDDLFGGAQ